MMRFSERIYRLLLKAYPESYRRRYEQPMAQLFADQLRTANTCGKLAALWLRTLADFLRTVPARHAPSRSLYGLDPVARVPFVAWSQPARHAVFFAREEASSFGRREITPEHLLAGILRGEHGIPMLDAAREEISREIEASEAAPRRTPPMEDLPISETARAILSAAKEEAARTQAANCTTRHLLAAILQQEHTLAARLLARYGIDRARLRF
jgi:Clp amino terminal domain, pathogenicity island component